MPEPLPVGNMNRPGEPKRGHALLKRCPFCGGWVQGRAETPRQARIALRISMVRHVEDGHLEGPEQVPRSERGEVRST
jgi:hypothetical protein